MSTQPSLFNTRPRRRKTGPLDKHRRFDRENAAAARIVLQRPDVYGAGLCEWARRVLASEYSRTGGHNQ